MGFIRMIPFCAGSNCAVLNDVQRYETEIFILPAKQPAKKLRTELDYPPRGGTQAGREKRRGLGAEEEVWGWDYGSEKDEPKNTKD